MLAADFVLGIGNRWANRHTGGIETYTPGPARSSTSTSSRPRSAGSSRPTTASSPTPRPRSSCSSRPPASAHGRTATAWAESARSASARMLRKTNFDNVPIKPQRVYEEMNRAFGPDVRYVSTIGLSQIQAAQLLHVFRPRHWINAGPGRPAGLDRAGRARRRDRRPGVDRRRALRRLRLPVHDRGAGGRRAVQHPVHPRAGEQRLPRADPPVAARLRHGLLRAAVLRQHQRAGGQRLRRRPRQGRRGLGCKAIRVFEPDRDPARRWSRPRS